MSAPSAPVMQILVDAVLPVTLVRWGNLLVLLDMPLLDDDNAIGTDDERAQTLPVDIWSLEPDERVDLVFLSHYLSCMRLVHALTVSTPALIARVLGPDTRVVCTQPTLELARFCMDELASRALGPDPHQAQLIHERMREQATVVAFGEHLPLSVTTTVLCVSSGYVLGSSAWVLERGSRKMAMIGYPCTDLTRYPEPLDEPALTGADLLLVGGLSLTQPVPWDTARDHFANLIAHHAHHRAPVYLSATPATHPAFLDMIHVSLSTLAHHAMLPTTTALVLSPSFRRVAEYANLAAAHVSPAQRARTQAGLLPVVPTDPARCTADDLDAAHALVSVASVADAVAVVMMAGRGEARDRSWVVVGDEVDVADVRDALTVGGPGTVSVLRDEAVTPSVAAGLVAALDPRVGSGGAELQELVERLRPRALVTHAGARNRRGDGELKPTMSSFPWIEVDRGAGWTAMDMPPEIYFVELDPELVDDLKLEPRLDLSDGGAYAQLVRCTWNLDSNTLAPISTAIEQLGGTCSTSQVRRFDPSRRFQFSALVDLLKLSLGQYSLQVQDHALVVPELDCQVTYDPRLGEVEIEYGLVEHAYVHEAVADALRTLLPKTLSI
ncbi:hypothetical protein BC828DRAFT_382188 [Blastocladiella britannica]|nr:hypothetical protein BC828DRAFT_382188 [Blastocladiella britannica]